MIIEFIVDKVFSELLDKVKKVIKDQDNNIEINKSDLKDSLFSQSNSVISWMNFVNFSELRSTRTLDSEYVDLNIQLTP